MRKRFSVISLLFSLLLIVGLGGCNNNVRDVLGLKNEAPDEYTVAPGNPLSIPPDFDLRPPVPGAPRPQYVETDEQAKQLITGREPSRVALPEEGAVAAVEPDDGLTKADRVFSQKLGLQEADPAIKDKLVEEHLPTLETEQKKKGFFARLFGGKEEEKLDPMVDATKENERIKKNKEEGKPINEGEVAVEEQTEKTTLQRMLEIFK